MKYKSVVLKPEDADLSKLTIEKIEKKVRGWSNALAQCKLLLHSKPDNVRLKHRHEYLSKCILNGVETRERKENARELKKLKSKN